MEQAAKGLTLPALKIVDEPRDNTSRFFYESLYVLKDHERLMNMYKLPAKYIKIQIAVVIVLFMIILIMLGE